MKAPIIGERVRDGAVDRVRLGRIVTVHYGERVTVDWDDGFREYRSGWAIGREGEAP